MKKNMFVQFSTLTFMLLLLGVSACRVAEEGAYATWDADSNALLDTNEFGTAWGESGYYARWDADRDGFINESEWNAGRNSFMTDYDEATLGTYDDWDVDADGRLAENEFRDEVFEIYDTDRDGYWANNEYGTWWGTFNAGL